MLVAVAARGTDWSAPCDPRFGRADGFVIIDSDTGQIVDAIRNPNVAAGGGAGINTAQMLANRGVKVIIAGAVGPNAFGVLQSAGIAVYSSAGYATVKDAYEAFKDGKLAPITAPGPEGHARPGGGFGPGGYGRGGGWGRGGW